MYFKSTIIILDIFFKLLTIKQFIVNREDFLKLVSFVGNMLPAASTTSSYGTSATKVVPMLMALVYTSLGFIRWIIGPVGFVFTKDTVRGSTAASTEWTLKWWWLAMVADGRFNFFLEQERQIIAPSTWQFSCNTAVDTILGIVTAIGFFQRRLIGYYTDFLVLAMCMTLHTAVKRFIENLQLEQGDINQDKLTITSELRTLANAKESAATAFSLTYRQFREMQKLARMINRLVGTNVTCVIIFTILFSAASLDDVFLASEGTYDGVRLSLIIWSLYRFRLNHNHFGGYCFPSL